MGGCQSTVLAFSIHHYSLCAVLLIIQGWVSLGAEAIERADGDIRPYGHSLVGAAVPSGPESPRRFAALPPFTRGAAVTHDQAPLLKGAGTGAARD